MSDTNIVTTTTSPRKPLLTRKQAVERLRELGYPLTLSTANKLCSMGLGPESGGVFGSRILYDEDVVVAWAQARSKAGKAARVKAASPAATADDTGTSPKPRRGRRPKPRPQVDGTADNSQTPIGA